MFDKPTRVWFEYKLRHRSMKNLRPRSMKKFLTEVSVSANIFYRKGVTVKQRFASVICQSKKQPNFGGCGCFFDVFYFLGFAEY